MKSNKLLIYIIIILILSNLFFIFKYKNNNIINKDSVEIVKVDSFIQVDTITKWYPKPISKIIRDTIYIPIDSIKTEGDSILLPREEKTYTDDSTYNVRISGFKPILEEITIFPKTYTIEKTKTVTVTKKDRWNIGLQVGSGYGIFTKQPDVYVGIGFQYNLW